MTRELKRHRRQAIDSQPREGDEEQAALNMKKPLREQTVMDEMGFGQQMRKLANGVITRYGRQTRPPEWI